MTPVSSVVLKTATRFFVPLFLLLSIFLLLRGHNLPGGGFIGGLVGAAAFALYTIAYGVSSARDALRIDPGQLVGIGLLLGVISGLVAAFTGRPFLSGEWVVLAFAGNELKLGSPMVFDVGVYLVVIGVVLKMMFSLEEAA